MGANTKIQWAHHTFSPWLGCTKVSPACDHCYAEAWGKSSGIVQWGPHADRRLVSDASWRLPIKLNRLAAVKGNFERIFPSLCDPFDNHPSIKQEWRGRFYRTIEATPSLRWMLLTKRPTNVAKFAPADWYRYWPSNVAIGCTVENRDELRRLHQLICIPAPVRFLSCEPLLEDLGEIDLTGIHLVICGGESGRGSRTMPRPAPYSLQRQCAEQGVPFFMKQLSQADTKAYGDFDSFPPELQLRQMPTGLAGI